MIGVSPSHPTLSEAFSSPVTDGRAYAPSNIQMIQNRCLPPSAKFISPLDSDRVDEGIAPYDYDQHYCSHPSFRSCPKIKKHLLFLFFVI